MGARTLEVPHPPGLRRVDLGFFPALDLGLRGRVPVTERFSLGLEVRYQTALGLTADETPAFDVAKTSDVRSHHLQFGIAPELRFAPAPDAMSLALVLGWAVRGFRPVIELSVPGFTLHGPWLRAELEIPFAGIAGVRLAPELTVLTGISEDLRVSSEFSGGGVGFGGEIALWIEATACLGFELGYREAHYFAATYGSRSFGDAERFGTLRGVLKY